MEAAQFADKLQQVLSELSYMDRDDMERMAAEAVEEFADADVRSYEDAGVLTRDQGMVVRLASGAEFQITIVRSK